MFDDPLVGLTAVILIGMAAQWLAWRLKLPSILLLLLFGFLAGPGRLGIVLPDKLFGDQLLLPLVSIAAALILFEGGLSLRLRDLGKNRAVVGRLVTVGVLVTWVGASLGAHYLLGMGVGLSILVGAILSVSGPTVVQPLLRHIRPQGASEAVLKWEGIVVDPVGATLAVLVFEGLSYGTLQTAASHAVVSLLVTVVVGVALGAGAAYLLIHMLRRYLIPDWLHNPVALALVVGSFAVSNLIQHDAGLLTVTVMGVVMANRADVSIGHIVEFKENLRVLMLSAVFVLLAARLRLEEVQALDARAFGFLALLILLVRPLGVYLSTLGSSLSWKERVFLAWVFPRGIVAAAVASVFALELGDAPGAEMLVPVTFFVIVGTVLVYGLTAGPLARRLGLSQPNPQGILFVGAHPWARQIAEAIQKEGIDVLVVDTNRRSIAGARLQGLPTWYGSALAEHAVEEIDFAKLGRLLALTPNDEVNTLATLHYLHLFGREKIFQLAPLAKENSARAEKVPTELQGRILFAEDATYQAIGSRFARGGTVRATPLTDQFTFADFQAEHGERALPLFSVKDGVLTTATPDRPFEPAPGHTVLAVVEEEPPGGR